MARRFIAQLGEREAIDEVYLVADKQLRANRNGNLYLQLRLSDRTGSITGMMWNASDRIYGSFENGNYLRVQGTTQFYNGALQMIVSRIERVDPRQVDETDFVTLAPQKVDQLTARLRELLREVQNYHLRNLAECVLMDEALMEKFTRAPAGVKNHHAYQGGLIEHVVSLMEVAAAVADHYEQLDGDLLRLGVLLHDLGKVDELTYERDLGYSDEGQLIGHVVIGASLLDQKIAQAQELAGEPFPRELYLRLKHMIVSHHGQYEYGSPKLPMTLEAIALHLLDNLDAKIHGIGQLMREDVNLDSHWTVYHPALARKLFKGERQANGSESDAD